MPVTKSAKKAMRSSNRKRQINLIRKNKVSSSLRTLRKAILNQESTENIQKLLSSAFSSLDKAAKKNLIHKNKANRKKSRLSAIVAKIDKVTP